MTASDLQENITQLNNGVTFMIKHSQKLFKVSVPPRALDPCSAAYLHTPFLEGLSQSCGCACSPEKGDFEKWLISFSDERGDGPEQ